MLYCTTERIATLLVKCGRQAAGRPTRICCRGSAQPGAVPRYRHVIGPPDRHVIYGVKTDGVSDSLTVAQGQAAQEAWARAL